MRHILIFLFITFNLGAEFDNEKNAIKPIIQISIPKCGTNLLLKCIKIITKKESDFSYGLPSVSSVSNNQKTHFFVSHARFTELNKQTLESFGPTIKFFIYRDPRDQLISHIFWGDGNLQRPPGEPQLSLAKIFALEQKVQILSEGSFYFYYKNLNFDEKILQLIFGGSAFYDGMGPYIPHYKTKGIADFYRSYLPWLELEDMCVIRFEDLIGARGGGNDGIQRETIRKIAKHLGKNLTNREIDTIARSLFGGVHTFREGKIGAWKKYFKRTHKECFKKMAGQLLIDLKYEKNMQW